LEKGEGASRIQKKKVGKKASKNNHEDRRQIGRGEKESFCWRGGSPEEREGPRGEACVRDFLSGPAVRMISVCGENRSAQKSARRLF